MTTATTETTMSSGQPGTRPVHAGGAAGTSIDRARPRDDTGSCRARRTRSPRPVTATRANSTPASPISTRTRATRSVPNSAPDTATSTATERTAIRVTGPKPARMSAHDPNADREPASTSAAAHSRRTTTRTRAGPSARTAAMRNR